MKPTLEQMRIACAEVCGWKNVRFCGQVLEQPGEYCMGQLKTDAFYSVPDYPTDLNAMHEAEKVLTPEKLTDYGIQLAKLTEYIGTDGAVHWGRLCRATAAQRLEAFLRVMRPEMFEL